MTPEDGNQRDSRPKVALIDDSRTIIHWVKSSLEARGFRVVYADTPIGASFMLSAEAPAVVLVDVNMASIMGTDLVRMLRKHAQLRTARLLLYSDTDEAKLAKLAADAGADGFIRKTGDAAMLAATIHRHLR